MAKKENIFEQLEIDCDEEFAYIAGYTAWGFPYGMRWEDMGIDPNLPMEEKLSLMEEQDCSTGETRLHPHDIIDQESPVFFEDIVEKFEEISASWTTFLNRKTGEFAYTPHEYGLFDEDEEMDKYLEITESVDWIRLPSQYDLYERDIMREFAMCFGNEKYSAKMLDILRKKKPYRRFKDFIKSSGIAQQYYAYRTAIYLDKAYDWCLENSIRFKLKNRSYLPAEIVEKYTTIADILAHGEKLPF